MRDVNDAENDQPRCPHLLVVLAELAVLVLLLVSGGLADLVT